MTPANRLAARALEALEALEPGYSRRVRGILVTRDLDDHAIYAAQVCGMVVSRGEAAAVADYVSRTGRRR